MKKQNVGLVVETPFPPVSRANLRLYRLATSLINKNYNVHMISPSTRIFNRYSGNFAGINIVQYRGFAQFLYHDIVRLLVRLIHLISAIFCIIQITKTNKIQIIHAWHPIASLSSILAGKLTRKKIFVDWTDFYSEIARLESPYLVPLFKWIELLIIKWSTLIITVSEEMKLALINKGANPKDVVVINDGVDTKFFNNNINSQSLRNKYNLSNSPTLIFHGDVKPIDGVDLLIKALPNVIKKIPNIKLIILGGGGKYYSYLKKLVKQNNLSNSIIWIGWIKHHLVPKYIAMADIGVMPLRSSLQTNTYLSFKLFEYWASGKPVIVSKLKAISKIVKHNVNGVIINPENIEELSDAIISLASNPQLSSNLGNNGRILVEKNFDWDVLMDQESEFYNKR